MISKENWCVPSALRMQCHKEEDICDEKNSKLAFNTGFAADPVRLRAKGIRSQLAGAV